MRKMGIVFIVLQDLLVGNVRNFLQGIEYSAIKYIKFGYNFAGIYFLITLKRNIINLNKDLATIY